MQSQEQEIQYDVYYRGTKEELFAFLFPLSGPSNPLFQHLDMTKMLYDVNKKSLELRYEPKDFENIDKQKEEITYKSTLLPIQSNYFYSMFQPDYHCFIWQNIDNFMEMRPKSKGMVSPKEPEDLVEGGKVELDQIEYDNSENKARELIDDTIVTPLKQNWETSKEEYLIHLAK